VRFLGWTCFVGKQTQHGPAFILHHHQAPHECRASKCDLVLTVRTVYYAGCCFGITYHFYCSDLVHLKAHWVVLSLFQLCNHSTWLPTPSSGKSTHTWCHRIENMSLFAVWCFQLCQRGISTGKLKIHRIDGSKYCAIIECNTMIIAPRMLQHPSSGANRPSDIAVTVNFNAEFNLMAVNPVIECFSRDLIPKYCQGLKSTVVYIAPPFFVESLHGRSNRSLPHLPLHIHAEEIISTFLTSNLYIKQCLPKAFTLTRLWL